MIRTASSRILIIEQVQKEMANRLLSLETIVDNLQQQIDCLSQNLCYIRTENDFVKVGYVNDYVIEEDEEEPIEEPYP